MRSIILLIALLFCLPAKGVDRRRIVPFQRPYVWETETIAYGSNVAFYGGSIDSAHLRAIDQFVKSAKANGYWTNLTEFSPLAGNQTNASVVKLGTYPRTANRLTISPAMTAAGYSINTGWTNDTSGSQRWLELGMTVGQITNAHPGFGCYVTSRLISPGDGAGNLCGYHSSPFFFLYSYYYPNSPDNGDYDEFAYFGSSTRVAVTYKSTSGLHGFIAVNRDNDSYSSMWSGRDIVGSAATAFNLVGNNNKFRLLSGQNVGENVNLSIGCYYLSSDLSSNNLSALYADVTTLMIGLGRERPPAKPLWIVPITGQGIACGSGTVAPVSRAYSSYDIYTGINGPYNSGSGILTGFGPCKEIGSQETPATAWMTEAMALGLDNAALFSQVQAGEGESYNAIKKGSSYYINVLANITNAAHYASPLFSGARVAAIHLVHGESDRSSAAYQANINTLLHDYSEDARAITGQATDPVAFHSQISLQPTVAESASDLAMLAEQEKSAVSNYVVCAKYHYPYADVSRLTAAGSQWLGEFYGKAFAGWAKTGYWTPLRPIKIELSGPTIVVTFTNCTGGLTFDTTHVAGATNFGFIYIDSTATQPAIDSASVTATNQVTITLKSTPTGIGKTLLYAIWNSGLTGGLGGTSDMLRGNLRNQDPMVGSLSTSNLWDWCVHFSKTVPWP